MDLYLIVIGVAILVVVYRLHSVLNHSYHHYYNHYLRLYCFFNTIINRHVYSYFY